MPDSIVILNGATEDGALDACLARVSAALVEAGHLLTELRLRDLDIRQCTGCWDCWVKSPGECKLADDMARVYSETIRADVVLLAAPLVMGYPGALLKRAVERLIPLLHPYLELSQGECHHTRRYDRYPDMALLVEPEADTDDEDLEIVRALFVRTALNFHAELVTMVTTETPVEEVCHALARG
jgi:multimeric flavodoxin WrbA